MERELVCLEQCEPAVGLVKMKLEESMCHSQQKSQQLFSGWTQLESHVFLPQRVKAVMKSLLVTLKSNVAQSRGQCVNSFWVRERHHFRGNQQLSPIFACAYWRKTSLWHLYAGPAVVTRNSNGDIVEASVLNSESLQMGKLKMPSTHHKGPEINIMWGHPYGWPLPFNIQIKWPNATLYSNRIFLSLFLGGSSSSWTQK